MSDIKNILIEHNILYKSGKLNPNSAVLIQKNAHLYNTIINQTSFLPQTALLRERLYCIVNNITKRQLCPVCNNPLHIKTSGKLEYPMFCSRRCSYDSTSTYLRKRETMKQRYGVEYTAQSSFLREKMQKTCLQKYAVKNPFSSQEVQQTIKQTIKQKYNVDNVMHNTQIKSKHKQSCKNKNFELINEKIKHSTFINNGYYHVAQKHLSQTQLQQLADVAYLKNLHHQQKLTLVEIAEIIGVDPSTISLKFIYHNIPITRFSTSIGEKQLLSFIQQNNIDVAVGNRNIIAPQEIDIFLPKQNIAIEYCGLYWHSDKHSRIHKNYHKNKYDLCNQKGIQLLTIFEDEWIERQLLVKQKILSMIGKDCRKRIFARKCTVIHVDNITKQEFFEKYHIQGNGPSSINLGLVYNNSLVAMMGFIQHQDKYYLNRYATKDHVVGGFTKLLEYFKNHYQWKQIISFADLRWSVGNLYQKTGWHLDKVLPPDYYYSKDGKTRTHKFNYRRKNLPKLLEHFDPLLSEKQNCDNNGILRIWDCGKQRWVINNK